MDNRTTLTIIGGIILLLIVGGVVWFVAQMNSPAPVQNQTQTTQTNNPVVYTNNQYGFNFALPDDWKGYTLVMATWSGDAVSKNGQVQMGVVTGPLISIRNPLWTDAAPYQDIPVMIFTTSQWNDLQQDKFHIGAAPIGPAKLSANSTYVFALPARYNYAYPAGWQEVDQIMQSEPLQAFDPVAAPPTSASVSIANFAFSPATITVKVGATVTWKNNDTMAHTVIGDNGGPMSQTIAPGASYSYTFNAVGNFDYHCSLHPTMKGSVQVTN